MCPAKAICPAPYAPQRVLFYANPRKGPEPKKKGGQNKILRPDQHQAMIRYAVDQATNGGKGATKQMMYNCAMWLRTQEGKTAPTWRWFQSSTEGQSCSHTCTE